jgi:hypothetical protein
MSSLVYFAGVCGTVVRPLSMASNGAGAVQQIVQVRESQEGLDLSGLLAQPFGSRTRVPSACWWLRLRPG